VIMDGLGGRGVMMLLVTSINLSIRGSKRVSLGVLDFIFLVFCR